MSADAPYGHILSKKSVDLERDTFFFISLHQSSQLFMGVNQKSTPVSSATIHHWVKLMGKDYWEPPVFFLCPVTVRSGGIMSYFVEPSGPVIEPSSTEPLPPGNYGWFFNRECTSKGFPELTLVRQRFCSYRLLFSLMWPDFQPSKMDPFPSVVEESVVARDQGRCRFTGLDDDATPAWIVPPTLSWETEDFGSSRGWDKTPFLVAANDLTMQKRLTLPFLSNHFSVDVDDGYRVLVLHPMGDAKRLLPTHLPRHSRDADTDRFLRFHCRYSLHITLRGGDISEDYSNEAILHAMDELGVDHIFADDPDSIKMVPLDDPRWQSALGKAILADVVQRRTAHLLYASEQSLSEHDLPESSPSPEPELDRKAMAKAYYEHYANEILDGDGWAWGSGGRIAAAS
ncbi:hypothetical protein C8J57DRAFT_1372509 [Mycena rebaudengoi]|nr:hypothetical protein C8J57DRAFT_1372509 [Mycena rebaudengoi]